MNGLIFDVQRFSVHDGPGVRTTVFFKGCPLRCRWCQNPESLRPAPEIAFHADRCAGDRACFDACPREALAAGPDRVDRNACDACGLCVEACARGALRVVGRRVGVGELVDEVARDAPFYGASGGGVTLSGGEPTAQLAFVAAFVEACQARGLGVGLQTCGAFSWERVRPLLGRLGFVHFDLKAIDPATHRRITGADNRTILDNGRRMARAGLPVSFRMPVIPGHTDGEENLRAVAGYLRGLGVRAITLLRCHGMGQAKLPRLGHPIPAVDLGDAAAHQASLEAAARLLAGEGLEVTR